MLDNTRMIQSTDDYASSHRALQAFLNIEFRHMIARVTHECPGAPFANIN